MYIVQSCSFLFTFFRISLFSRNSYMNEFSSASHFAPMLIILTCNAYIAIMLVLAVPLPLFTFVLSSVLSELCLNFHNILLFLCIFHFILFFVFFDKSTFMHFFRILLQWFLPRNYRLNSSSFTFRFNVGDTYLIMPHKLGRRIRFGISIQRTKSVQQQQRQLLKDLTIFRNSIFVSPSSSLFLVKRY